MKLIRICLFIAILNVFGCVSHPPRDTNGMLGMPIMDCIAKYRLDKGEAWWTPNLPIDADQQATYFLAKGNLELNVGTNGIITYATYTPTNVPLKKRMESVYKGWDEYVKQLTGTRKTQP